MTERCLTYLPSKMRFPAVPLVSKLLQMHCFQRAWPTLPVHTHILFPIFLIRNKHVELIWTFHWGWATFLDVNQYLLFQRQHRPILYYWVQWQGRYLNSIWLWVKFWFDTESRVLSWSSMAYLKVLIWRLSHCDHLGTRLSMLGTYWRACVWRALLVETLSSLWSRSLREWVRFLRRRGSFRSCSHFGWPREKFRFLNDR